jgi:hypothetical protein
MKGEINMALILNGVGDHVEHDIMRWTCNDVSELPKEDEKLTIPLGSQCKVIHNKTLVIYIYDNVAKEWFIP